MTVPALANGRLTSRATEAAFITRLTTGTAVVVSFSGKLGGTINGMPISGSGNLEYTYNFGTAAWELTASGLASGPQLPAGMIKFVPGSGASGVMAVHTSGVVTTQEGYGLEDQKDRHVWPLKGRTAPITVIALGGVIVPPPPDTETCQLPTSCIDFGGIAGGCTNVRFTSSPECVAACNEFVNDNTC